MLSLSNVSAGMAFSYFSNDDYYASKQNKVDVFGSLCKSLELDSKVSKREFGNLLNGLTPDGSVVLAKQFSKNLDLESVNKSLVLFKKSIKKTSLSPHQVTVLSDQINLSVSNSVSGKNFKSLTIKQKQSIELMTNLYLKKWRLDKENKKIVRDSTVYLLKKIAPETRRSGTDMTFSAPKSVSILGLVGGRKEIIKCHQQAVSFAIKYIEKEYFGTRSTENKHTFFTKTGKMIGAKFMHGTSREGDPQLHTHCVVFNLTKSHNDKWVSTSNDQIYSNSKLLGVIYKNKLAQLIQSKGYEIEPTGNGSFKVKGYSDKQIMGFSKRRKQVLEEGAKIIFQSQKKDPDSQKKSFEEQKKDLMKQVSQRLARVSVYRGRKAKKAIKKQDFKKKWMKESKELDIKHPLKSNPFLWGSKLDLTSPLQQVSERKAIFKTNVVELQTLIHNLGKSTFEAIKSALHSSPDLVIANSKKDLAANIDQLRLERDLIKSVKNQEYFRPLGTADNAESIAKKRQYSPGQRDALRLSLTSKDQFMLWNGVAGSGKSYALGDLKRLAEKQNIKVFALAPDGGSARELGKSIGSISSTVHRFLIKKEECKQSLLIVDEATKLSTKSMLDLINQAKKNESRILFVGDRRQFTAVEAGNSFEVLYQKIEKTELTEHLRQDNNSVIKEAVEQASLQTVDGLKFSSKAIDTSIVERKSEKGRQAQFIKNFLKLEPKDREKTLLLVDLNHDRQKVTHALRSALQKEGSLSKNEVSLPILCPKSLSETQKKQSTFYSKRDVVVSYGQASSLQPGMSYEVVGVDKNKLKLAANGKITEQDLATFSGNVYRQESIQVAKGDTLEWRKNQGNRLNRDALTVTETTGKSITVQDKTGQKVILPTTSPQHVDYALVKTSYSSQGATADRVIALSTSRSSMQSWYVTLSRARKDVTIVTENKEKLTKNIFKSSKQKNALDESRKEDLEQYVKKWAKVPEKKLRIATDEMKKGINFNRI